MKFKIVNNSTIDIDIKDLGIFLTPDDFTFLDTLPELAVIESEDLKRFIESGEIEVFLENNVLEYFKFIISWTKLNSFSHENLSTLSHNVSTDSYFMKSFKNAEGQTSNVIYFLDETESIKVREEEVIRDVSGKSFKIITKQYDINGNLISTITDTLNRSASGSVSSISSLKT